MEILAELRDDRRAADLTGHAGLHASLPCSLRGGELVDSQR